MASPRNTRHPRHLSRLAALRPLLSFWDTFKLNLKKSKPESTVSDPPVYDIPISLSTAAVDCPEGCFEDPRTAPYHPTETISNSNTEQSYPSQASLTQREMGLEWPWYERWLCGGRLRQEREEEKLKEECEEQVVMGLIKGLKYVEKYSDMFWQTMEARSLLRRVEIC